MAVILTAGTPFQATASVTSGTVTLPSGLTAGDFTFLFCTLNASSGVITAPAGWSTAFASAQSTASTSHASAIYYRAWQPGDSNPAVTCTSGRLAVLPVKVVGADASPIEGTVGSTTQGAATTSVDAPSQTATSSKLLVTMHSGRSSTNGVFLTWTPPSGMTEVGEAGSQAGAQTNASLEVASLVVSVGATGAQTATSSSTATGSRGISMLLLEAGPPVLAFDAKSRNGAADTTLSTTDMSWTHTPVGTPRGVIVAVIEDLNTDQVTAVTYGGVALARTISTPRNVTETSRVYLYFLGSGIPTGAQTVAVTVSGAAPKVAHCFTVTAASDTTVDSFDGADLGIIANPSETVTHSGSLTGWFGVAAHYYGGAAPVATGLQAGETYGYGVDFGAAAGMTYYRTGGAAASSSTYGYTTLASDDQLIAALVIKESAPSIPSGSGTGTSTYAGSGSGAREPKASGTGTSAYAGSGSGTTTRSGSGTGASAYSGNGTGGAPKRGSGAGANTYAGSGAGKRVPKASGTGSAAYSGTGSGQRTPKGSGTGTGMYSGTGSGKRTPKATGSGTSAYAGSGSGTAPAIAGKTGSGTGTSTYSGSGVGKRQPKASGTGASSYSGSGLGFAPVVGSKNGSGSGSSTYAGSGSGKRTPKASGTGATAYAGSGSGVRPSVGAKQGSGSGAWAYVGSGVGERTPKGGGNGASVYLGSGEGGRLSRGEGGGELAYVGSGVGTNITVGPVVPRAIVAVLREGRIVVTMSTRGRYDATEQGSNYEARLR